MEYEGLETWRNLTCKWLGWTATRYRIYVNGESNGSGQKYASRGSLKSMHLQHVSGRVNKYLDDEVTEIDQTWNFC